MADILLTRPEEDVAPVNLPVGAPASIEVEDLWFRYGDGEPWILRECSFRIEPGTSVAITGPSGCGKTTLVKILLGLLKPDRGRVLVGGIPLTQLGATAYRRMVGAVMQEDRLFAGPLAENIAFSDNEIDLAAVEQAAREAGIHDDICAMPMAYNTLLGDMGTTLSGGQKQRVLLARAIHRRPRFLFLDEATSHLDVGREREVNAAIGQLSMTRIIVAHRSDTIASADHVLVLKSGQLVPTTRATPAPMSPSAAGLELVPRPDPA